MDSTFDAPVDCVLPGAAVWTEEREPARALEVDDHLASVVTPRSLASDQYRLLRHFIDQERERREVKVLAVTSPCAREGKTLTAVNLAATLARSGRARVLLVDADLRRPSVSLSLGLRSGGPGLVGALLDEALDLGAAVRSTPFHVDVLPAGPPAADAYRVLESPRLGRVLDAARAAYEYVVLDMPPLLVVPDGRLMASRVDGFLVVVAANRTPRKLLGKTLGALDAARVVGIVFNGDDRPLHEGYGGYYDDSADARPGWRRWWRGGGSRRHTWR
jgi:capsular exopolysaccharide synthesis family protein